MSKTVRRIGRANAAYSRKVSVIRIWDRVVADAVKSNPSPLPNSLLTGKRTGNFSIVGQIAAQRSSFVQ